MARRSVARVDRKRLQPAKEASGDTPVLEHVTVHATEMVQASVMLITADKQRSAAAINCASERKRSRR